MSSNLIASVGSIALLKFWEIYKRKEVIVMWVVCYDVAGRAIMTGKIIGESNSTITIENSARGAWETSRWNENYVEKFDSRVGAQKAFDEIYRYKCRQQ